MEEVTYNIGDQKFHEFEVRRQCPDAMVLRKTLAEVRQQGQVTQVRPIRYLGTRQCLVPVPVSDLYKAENDHNGPDILLLKIIKF